MVTRAARLAHDGEMRRFTVGMDPLSAHLDRGWELFSQGDAKGARACARRALELDGSSPEAHTLLGQVAAQEGEYDTAMEHFRTAMALDDGYPDPMLNAAELLIHPLQDYEGAIELCDEVLEFVDTREEIVDAMLLKFDALLAKGDDEAAKRLLDALPEGPYEQPGQSFLLGRARFEVGDAELAEAHLADALRDDARNPDVHYYLGLVREQKRDWRGAAVAFLECRGLDRELPAAPWSLPREQFHRTVVRALEQVEAPIARALEGALVVVEDSPGVEVVAEGIEPRAPLLLDGIGGDAPADGPGRLVRLFVYQRNLERLCGAIEELEDEIAHQVSEEVRHLLGATDVRKVAPPSPAAPDDDRKKPRKSRN